jgi:Uncharacterized protein conserved in bacteria (DUF2188)
MMKTPKKAPVRPLTSADRYVVPNIRQGGWDIIKLGHRRATGHAETKDQAIRIARGSVRDEGGGELRILNRFGKQTDIRTVAPARRRAA